MVTSLQHINKSAAETIILATSNPFTALFIGLLITAMIQSSSTTTAMVVALVASGSITLQSAIPIMMGANVGTTITSTIVSLGFINKKKEFRRAAAAGTYDGFFNILVVVILFPLEYYYGFLSGLSNWIVTYFFHPSAAPVQNSFAPRLYMFGPVTEYIVNIISNGFVLALVAFVLLFSSILLFRRLISKLLLASSPERFSRFFFKNGWKSFFWGTVTTAAIRSSTITTSVVVPIVAQRIVSLRKAAPFILGANIGTTITAFIAALLNSNTSGALSIAIAHFLFNLIGVAVFYPIPILRKIPLELANRLGRLTLRYRLTVFVYILVIFFFLPFSLIYLNKNSVQVVDVSYHRQQANTGYRVVSKLQSWNKTGQWLVYENNSEDPTHMHPVYLKNNILFIDNEMFLFNKPGFCWDGEVRQEKFRTCVTSILPTWSANTTLSFDSVYVFEQQFYNRDSTVVKIYMNRQFPVILKRETSRIGLPVETEEIVAFSKH